MKNYDVKINPKSQKSLKFTPTLKGVLAISAFSPFRVGVKKAEIGKTDFL